MVSTEDTDGLVIELQGISSLSADNQQWRIETPDVFNSSIVCVINLLWHHKSDPTLIKVLTCRMRESSHYEPGMSY